MKILVISRNPWDDTNSIGNTLSNFFGGVEDVEFAAIYFRSAKPNNKLCKKYYRTSEIEVARKWFKPNRIGKSFTLEGGATVDRESGKNEKKLVRLIHKYGLKLAYKLSDHLWYSKKWINRNLDAFIEDFAPDLVVTFVKSAPQYYLTVKHLREKYNVPLFTWIADDEYTALKKKKAQREIDNLEYILKQSAQVTGCSTEICEYYNSIFGCEAKPLYKSCDLSTPVKESVNDPLTIVYAGNLLYGRLEIISRIAKEINKMAESGVNVLFEVYSNTELSDQEMQNAFCNSEFTKYMGRRDYDYIKHRLSEADIVLHVESFEDEEILKTRYSFSTKIIDYLQSGSVILAVGPEQIASMRYISHIPGAKVINSLDCLESDLKSLLSDAPYFSRYASESREFAEQNHSCASAAEKMAKMFNEIVKGGV